MDLGLLGALVLFLGIGLGLLAFMFYDRGVSIQPSDGLETDVKDMVFIFFMAVVVIFVGLVLMGLG